MNMTIRSPLPGPLSRARLLRLACLGLLAAGAIASPAHAATPPAEISIPGERVFPESLTSTRDGTVIIGGLGARTVFRARPGSANAEVWIAPGSIPGLHSVFGVLADEKAGTLWACSGSFGPPQPGAPPPPPPALFAFDLKKGTPRASYPLPVPGGFCNDVALDAKGNAYVTDTNNMQVLKLAKGAKALEPWAGGAGEFGPRGGVLDGIVVLGDRVLVNALATSKFFSVPIGKDGQAGAVSEIQLDRVVERPDGMRSHGSSSLLVAEGGGGGKATLIELDGNSGKVTTLKEGLAGGPVAVTAVGNTVYVLEGQLALMMRPNPGVSPGPFRAVAVSLPQ